MFPTRKVTSAAAGGALATLILYVSEVFGLDLPSPAAGAVATLAAFGLAWLTGEQDAPGVHAAGA